LRLASDHTSEKLDQEQTIIGAEKDAARDDSKFWSSAASIAAMVGFSTLVAMLLTLAWGLDRGIEFRDDGLAMLCMANPTRYCQPEAIGYFLRLCPHLVPSDIVNLRLLHILSSLIGASVLAWGLTRWAAARCQTLVADRWLTAGLWIASAIGSLMAFGVLSPALSYNGLTALFIFSAAGCLFYALSFSESSPRGQLALVVSGALVALGFFSKFCAALLFIGVAAVLVFTAARRRMLPVLGWSSIGLVVGAGLFFTIVQAPQPWWQSFSEAIRLELSGAHSPGVVFGATGISLAKHLLEVLVAVVMIAAASLVLVKSPGRPAAKAGVIWSTLIASTTGFTLLSFVRIGYAHTLLLYVPVLTIAVAATFFIAETGWKKSVEQGLDKPLYMVLSLVLLSVATAAGSNNVLGWQMVNYFAPIMVFYWIAYLAIARYLRSRAFLVAATTLLFLTGLGVFFQGYVIAPHGTDSLFEQNETANAPARIAGLKLSRGDLKFIQETDRVLRGAGFHAGNAVIALYDLPMLTYTVDAVSAGGAWYYADPRDVPKNEQYMERARHETEPLFLIVYVIKAESPDVNQFLNRHGFDLDHDFRLIGTTQREHWGGIARIYRYLNNPERQLHE